ncbi:MAG: Fungal specific transcription factor [Piccolia ochrophora]|nr:MAG: Fungal specific transcription factor [Piccolia ochrophora]
MATEGQHFQWTRHVQHIGTTTESEPRLFDLCLFDHNNESVTPQGAVRKVGDGDTFLKLSDEESVREGEQFHARAVGTLVGSYGARLVEIYFERVHPGFPILHKQRVLGDLADPRQRIPPPLFAAICLLALRWWHQVPGLANEQKPNPGDLEQAALNSLESAMAKPRFSTIQAGLLLQQRAGGESWPLTSQLVALGQELGLHLDCSQWQIPSWERGVRKRLAWALFMQDKWGSLIHGRPSHIFRANWAVGEVTDEDFDEDDTLEEGLEAQKMRLLFTQTIALTGLLSDVLDAFYTLQAAREAETAGENGTQLILDRAKPIQIKLKDWFKRLPPCLRMDHTDSGNLSSTGWLNIDIIKFCLLTTALGYLHLAYYATEITLHRCIVRSLRPLETDPYLLHICRSAAKTRLISAMDFVNRLKPEHLRSFWYFASRVNFALIGTFGSLLWATAPSKEEADFYRLRLGEYRWTLTVSSRSAKFIAFAVDALDSSTLLLQNLQEKPSISSGIKREPQDLEHDRTMVDVASVMHSSDFEPSGNGGGSSGDPSSTASGLASPSTSSSTGSGSRDAQTAPSEPFELIKTEDASFDFLPDRR